MEAREDGARLTVSKFPLRKRVIAQAVMKLESLQVKGLQFAGSRERREPVAQLIREIRLPIVHESRQFLTRFFLGGDRKCYGDLDYILQLRFSEALRRHLLRWSTT